MVQPRATKQRNDKPSSVDPISKELFLEFLKTNVARFERTLKQQLGKEKALITRGGPAVKTTTQALSELCLRGGKRVRPAFVWVGCLSVDPRPNRDALDQAGAALELLHNYFLVHDDWMDGDLVRRGGKSVHAMLRERFGSIGIGDSAAILAGDWGVAVATKWMATLPIPKHRLGDALTCFSDMQIFAITGQIRDLIATDNRPEITYEFKTGSYTVSGPLKLGAIIGGAKSKDLETLDSFALPIGIAFQLKDDLLGVFSAESVTGKPFASDLRQGKKTVLLLEAQRRASAAERRVMDRVIGRIDTSENDLRRIVRFLDECGAKSAVEKRVEKLHKKALSILDGSTLRTEGKDLLRSAATALISRES